MQVSINPQDLYRGPLITQAKIVHFISLVCFFNTLLPVPAVEHKNMFLL